MLLFKALALFVAAVAAAPTPATAETEHVSHADAIIGEDSGAHIQNCYNWIKRDDGSMYLEKKSPGDNC
jgi:Spy/CpxP family protein refolding chaperone